ncbi:hypothetical protein KY290_012761 [Solanum tuberosum]|uniref:CCHC-type domain-containing protein n=1 Tax=Solanum tuberosum TaxID=4113 RepID=A0ABQ7VM15_SOLTU|nr:hypothetical protein KY285_012632 [Solanum tuberosum]KAH0768780.1 hypothetical protein KY290_012761 [Solanum tuberosum]
MFVMLVLHNKSGELLKGYKSIKCHRCGELGHVHRYCCVKLSKENVACEDEQYDEPKWEHCFAIEDVEIKDNATFELAPNKSHINYVDLKEEWIVDSACTHHVTGDDSLFSELRQHKGERVIVTADNSTYLVMKEGVVEIDDVKVLVNMKNIEADVLFAAKKKGSLFVMLVREAYVKKTRQIDNAAIWHARLGHLGYQMLQNISSDKLLDGMPPMKIAQQVICLAVWEITPPSFQKLIK